MINKSSHAARIGFVPVVLLSVFAMPRLSFGQGTVTLSAGAANTRVAPGSTLTVPIALDLSGAGGGSVQSISSTITWDRAFLTFDSAKATAFGSLSSDISLVSAGQLGLVATAAAPTVSSTQIANLYFTVASRSGGSRLSLAPLTARNDIGWILSGQLIGRGTDVCVAASGKWGDADADGSVTVIDAQQIARLAVGLSVIDPSTAMAQGDVNGDGVVDVLDAQGVARFVIGLSAPARVDQDRGATPMASTLRINQSAPTIALGKTGVLIATPFDADEFTLVGCQPITWASSDPSKVTVNAAGGIKAIGAGSATITATSGSATAQSTVTVTTTDATAALQRLRNITAGGSSTMDGAWLLSGLLTDEWKSSDTFAERNDIDRRSVADLDSLARTNLRELLHARTDARAAVVAMIASGAPLAARAQMYFIEGYAELLLSETFCSGIPLPSQTNGLTMSGPLVSTAATVAAAIAHFDSAAALATGGDQLSNTIASDAKIAKGRALLQQLNGAAAAASVSSVPTAFQDLSTLSGTEQNKLWLFNAIGRYTVGDNPDAAGTIANALNFASAADPRSPVFGTTLGTSPAGKGADGTTNLVRSSLFTQTSITPLLSGLDARLIEAEAKLRAADLAGMMTILNALRAVPQNLGAVTSPVMAPLATPASVPAATDLFLREKAFWTFGRGQRLGDLRRFLAPLPSGAFFKGGTYGTTNFFVAAVDEEGNTLASFCSAP